MRALGHLDLKEVILYLKWYENYPRRIWLLKLQKILTMIALTISLLLFLSALMAYEEKKVIIYCLLHKMQ